MFDKGTGKPNIWLYSSPMEGSYVSLSRSTLLESLGCLDNVADTKLGDRISLAFTQTTPIDEIPLDCIVAEPELAGNGYRFSDGCGVMGPAVARKVQEVLGLPEVPGAIQIRMGGVKGMLSYKHDYPEHKIGIRPSMVKFRSTQRVLEVTRVACVKENPDNKLFFQMILIMHHQGIPNRIMLELQAKAFADMARQFDKGAGGITDAFEYSQHVVMHGKKADGNPFSEKEFGALRKSMIESKERLNLRCSVVMMFGVIDEHDILEEGEVLVGNGKIHGPVLVSRSPCLTPGDVQKAHAVAGREGGDRFAQTYTKLKDLIVFSSKGKRPLADKLGGGDLDGDEFYILTERRLVENMESVEAYDYGSRENEDDMKIRINTRSCFSVPESPAPVLATNQLSVLRRFMLLGDIVSASSDAWIRVADAEGPGSSRALSMAHLCQQALDARKLAFQIDQDQINTMNRIRRELKAPHWRAGGTRPSDSILGKLYNIWVTWIRYLEAARDRQFRRYLGEHDEMLDQSVSQLDIDTVASTESECTLCLDRGIMQCSFCLETVWFCGDECRRIHDSVAGHTSGSRDTLGQTSLLKTLQESDEPFSLTSNAMEALLDVTFGRTRPTCTGAEPIDFRSLKETDLKVLSKMVLVEFYASLKASMDDDEATTSSDTPHAFDVFLMNSAFSSPGSELAVCRPGPNGDLMWFDKYNNSVHLEEASYDRRVSSLSGPGRILESLMAKPAVGSLMYQAMQRDIVGAVTRNDLLPLNSPIVDSLNQSQRRLVETVLSTQAGIVACLGPPGEPHFAM